MNLDALKSAATSKFARQILTARQHSPKLMFAVGVTGMVGTVVLACRATLKTNDLLEQHEKGSDYYREAAGTETISHEEADRELKKLKRKLGLNIVKLYAPAVGVGLVSIGALTGSHIVLNKRNSVAMATVAALQKGYDEYRQRVRDEYGDDIDKKFAIGGEDIKRDETLAGGKVETKTVTKPGGKGRSPYAALFDEKSKHWTREPGMNSVTLQVQQQYANDKLRAKGHVFLNEIYDMLDLPRTPAGQIVGWVWDPNGEKFPGQIRDNYIDFGVWDDQDAGDDFVSGREPSVWINPNVDGPVWELIGK